MKKAFTRTTKHQGVGLDCAIVTDFDGRVLIRASDRVSGAFTTIAMTPDQARALAQGIVDAADRAEGKQ